jgi:hypothetical protein
MPLLLPATRKVSFSISFLISSKSVNRRLGRCKNSPYSAPGRDEDDCGGALEEATWISWSTSGRRVTIPDPLGRKSRPTILGIKKWQTNKRRSVFFSWIQMNIVRWIHTFLGQTISLSSVSPLRRSEVNRQFRRQSHWKYLGAYLPTRWDLLSKEFFSRQLRDKFLRMWNMDDESYLRPWWFESL